MRYPIGANDGQMPWRAFSVMPFRVSSVEPIGLLDEQNQTHTVLSNEWDHLPECETSGLFRSLDIDEFLHNSDAMVERITSQQFQLGDMIFRKARISSTTRTSGPTSRLPTIRRLNWIRCLGPLGFCGATRICANYRAAGTSRGLSARFRANGPPARADLQTRNGRRGRSAASGNI